MDNLISKEARIGNNVKFGHGCIIDDNTEIGDNCEIGNYSIIKKNTIIAENNIIGDYCVIGGDSQWSNKELEDGSVNIGKNNIFREFVTVNKGGLLDTHGTTIIGDNNFFMAYVHIAHDCNLSNNIIISNLSQLAGHVTVGSNVVISASALVHQFCNLGTFSFIGGRSTIRKDVLPYTMVEGAEMVVTATKGININGLKKHGVNMEVINVLKKVYKIIFNNNLLRKDIICQLESYAAKYIEVNQIVNFLKLSKRGILRANKKATTYA